VLVKAGTRNPLALYTCNNNVSQLVLALTASSGPSDISRITFGSGLVLAKECTEELTLLACGGVWVFCTSPIFSESCRGLPSPLAMFEVGIIVRSPWADVMFRVAAGRAVPGGGFCFFVPKRNDILAGEEVRDQLGRDQACDSGRGHWSFRASDYVCCLRWEMVEE
jgi:hypothetical protein